MKPNCLYIAVFFFILVGFTACNASASPTLMPATITAQPTFTIMPSPSPTQPPLTGLITFDSDRDEAGWGIYAKNADGTGEVTLITSSWVGGDEYSAWSPDGQFIAFHSYRSGAFADIYLINADSTGLKQLTNSPAHEIKPAWSPDGQQIAFYSSENGEPPYKIYLMNKDGGNLRLVTSYAAGSSAPSFSPDGSMIVFDAYSGDYLEIFEIGVDGKGMKKLTQNSSSAGPSWSPDGKTIVFTSGRYRSSEIYLMKADGSGVIRLTTDSTSYEPSWSPDGNYIVFISERSGNADIFIMKADGSDVMQLTDDPSSEYCPRWSPVEVSLSNDPWFGPPYCLRDTDGDYRPDTATTTFIAGEIAYIEFPYRNMTDGMSFSHKWIFENAEMIPEFMSPWDGGDSGWHSSYSLISSKAVGKMKVQLFIDNQLIQEVMCDVAEP